MTDELLSLVITFAILAALFVWVPTTDFCNDRCQQLLLRRRAARSRLAAAAVVAAESTDQQKLQPNIHTRDN